MKMIHANLSRPWMDGEILVGRKGHRIVKLYVYDEATRKVIAVIEGETCDQCEAKAAEYGTDGIGWTYSPAFGTPDGLTE